MRILIADDERELAAALAEFLVTARHQVCTITTGGLDVLPAYDRFRPDVTLIDILMPGFNGVSIAHALLARHPGVKLVLCSGALSAGHPFIAGCEAFHFLQKPFSFSEARRLLESLAPAVQAAA